MKEQVIEKLKKILEYIEKEETPDDVKFDNILWNIDILCDEALSEWEF